MAAGFGTGFSYGEALAPADYETLRMLVGTYGTQLLMSVLQEMDGVTTQDLSSSWAGHDTKPIQAQGCAGGGSGGNFSNAHLAFSAPNLMDIDNNGGFRDSGRSDTSSPQVQSHYAPSSAASPPLFELSPPLGPVTWPTSSWPGISLAPFASPLLEALPEGRLSALPPPRSVPPPSSAYSSPGAQLEEGGTFATAATSSSSAAAARKAIECPLCSAHGISVGFGRKSDLKKHLYRFHGHDHLWLCSAPGCGRAFDLEKAYAAHMKSSHDVSLAAGDPALGMAVVTLPRRRVFACGFEGCKAVFEGQGSAGTAVLLERYFDHLTGHFGKSRGDDGLPGGEWGFSAQMQNLLRQSALKGAWKGYGDKAARAQLRWRAGASGLLRATLETGQFGGDVNEVLRAALQQGEMPSSQA